MATVTARSMVQITPAEASALSIIVQAAPGRRHRVFAKVKQALRPKAQRMAMKVVRQWRTSNGVRRRNGVRP